MLAATLVAPGHNRTVSLMPEFLAPQDGCAKQDCERNAAKRWLSAHAERVRPLRPVYLGDDLFCCQPLAEAVLATGADFLFVAQKRQPQDALRVPQGHRSGTPYRARTQARKPFRHLYLPLDRESSAAPRGRRPEGQLDRGHAHRRLGQNHLQRCLRRQPARHPGDRGRHRRLRPSPLEEAKMKGRFPPFPQTLKIDETDSHIPTAATTTRMNKNPPEPAG